MDRDRVIGRVVVGRAVALVEMADDVSGRRRVGEQADEDELGDLE
jgi:hypothetical protein